MSDLGDWAKKQSKNITLGDGEQITARYKGFKIGVNPFDSEQEMVFYKLEIEISGEKMDKTFKSQSGKAARFFDSVNVGDYVTIKRTGKRMNTKYQFGKGTELTEEEEEIAF